MDINQIIRGDIPVINADTVARFLVRTALYELDSWGQKTCFKYLGYRFQTSTFEYVCLLIPLCF